MHVQIRDEETNRLTRRFNLTTPKKSEETMMKRFGSAVLGIVGVLAFTATDASAAIVCNEVGDCWHVKERYTYEPAFKLSIHPDEWKWEDKDKERYRWREPGRGHGYWHSGRWVVIR